MENILKGQLLDTEVRVWFTGMLNRETKESETWVEVTVQKPDGSFCHGRFQAKWLVTETHKGPSRLLK